MARIERITDGRFVYLRNYHPHVSQAQRVAYQFETPSTQAWHDHFMRGLTNEAQSIFWRVPKDSEELYDLESDPDEVRNLADSKDHHSILQEMRNALAKHLEHTKDVCFLPEIEMHARSKGSTPYEIARDPSKYAQQKIMAAASTASNLEDGSEIELIALLSDEESAVRYWGAIGLLIRGEAAVSNHENTLNKALSDFSPAVRIVAAQALIQYGSNDSLDPALAALKSLASPDENGVLVSMSALTAIEAISDKGVSLRSMIERLRPDGPSPHSRYDGYVPRLIDNILSDSNTKRNP